MYVRRGSSTDLKPAKPDEIALMGSNQSTTSTGPVLAVEFADANRDIGVGTTINWEAENIAIPPKASIPLLKVKDNKFTMPDGSVISFPNLDNLSGPLGKRLNANYYRELANYVACLKLAKLIRLAVSNSGDLSGENIRIEFTVNQNGCLRIFHEDEFPDQPERETSGFAMTFGRGHTGNRLVRHDGEMHIVARAETITATVEFDILQPGRTAFTDRFFVLVPETGVASIDGHIFASNQPTAIPFQLKIDAVIQQEEMTVDALLSFARQLQQVKD